VTTVSSGERDHSTGPANKADDPSVVPNQQLPKGTTREAAPSQQQDEKARRHFDALAQRINDTYTRFTRGDMELLKALGWG
jgi:hypothetical protein